MKRQEAAISPSNVLLRGLFGGLKGTLFDLLQTVSRRNKKILKMFNNKLLLANFRILRYNTVLSKF